MLALLGQVLTLICFASLSLGGQIHDVHASFIDQYLDQIDKGLDIVLACGVNNILTEDGPETIINSYKSFLKSIQRHAKQHAVTDRYTFF